MELLSLSRRLELGPLPPEEASRILVSVAQQVSAWHSRGLLHRQLTPESISLGATGEEINVEEPSFDPVPCGGPQWDADTAPSEFSTPSPIAVPSSLSDAQAAFAAANLKLDPTQIDIYQLGALFCRLLTGEGVTAYLSRLKNKSRVPQGWRPLLDKALGCSPDGRLSSAAEFAAALLRSQMQTQVASDTSPTENPSAVAEKSAPLKRLGDYEIRERIGRGGMGDVFQAFDERRNQLVAVKVLPEELARHTDFVRRFYAEAAAAAKLTHRHIIEILYVGEDQGRHFFVMEYIAGESLGDRLTRQCPLPVNEAVEMTRQILSALTAAHDEGLIHRDIKPSNILLDKAQRRAVLADFGLVKSLQETTGLTATGVVVGSVQYISPEQARGRTVDGRSDLYSLGVLLYQMLSGELPFTGDGTTALIFQHVYEPARPLIEVAPALSPVLGVIVDKLLAKSPDQRYASAAMVADDLTAFIQGDPLPSGADIVESDDEASSDHDDQPLNTTVIISAPKFDQTPPISLPEPAKASEPSPARTSWWRRAEQGVWKAIQDQAPGFADSLQSTQQQLDGAVEEYERRQQTLQQLSRKALQLLQELRRQRDDWKAAAANQDDPEQQSRCRQNLDELANQITQQQEQLSDMRLQQAKVSATLERLRSQRDVLQARMKVVEASLRMSGLKRRRKLALSVAGLVLSFALLVVLWIYLDGKSILKTAADLRKLIPVAATPAFTPMPLAIPEDKLELPQQLLKGSTATVDCLAFSPDGKYVYAGGRNGHLLMWNLDNGRLLQDQVYKDGTTPLGFTGIAVDAASQRVMTWQANAATLKNLQIWSPELDGTPQAFVSENIREIIPAPDLQQAIRLSYNTNNRHQILDLFSVSARSVLQGISEDVVAAGYSPDAQLLGFIKHEDGKLRLWSLKEKREIGVISRPGDAGEVGKVVLSRDGRWAAIVKRGKRNESSVELWNLGTARRMFEYGSRGGYLRALAFQPGTDLLAVATQNRVELWDIERKRVRKAFHGKEIFGLAFSPDGKTLAGGGGTMTDPTLVLWDATPEAVVTTGSPRTLKGAGPAALSADGKRYASMEGADFVLRELADDRELVRVQTSSSGANRLILSADDRLAMVSFGTNHDQSSKNLIDVEAGKIRYSRVGSNQFQFTNDGRSVLYRDKRDLMKWDVESSESAVALPGAADAILCMAVPQAGPLVALGGWDQKSKLILCDLTKPNFVRHLPLDDHYVWSVSFSADGSKLAAGSRSLVTIWDTATGRQELKIAGDDIWTKGLAFSPQGDALAGGSLHLSIWSTLTGQKQITFQKNISSSLAAEIVNFTPDGRYLLATSPGQPVLLYDRTALVSPDEKLPSPGKT